MSSVEPVDTPERVSIRPEAQTMLHVWHHDGMLAHQPRHATRTTHPERPERLEETAIAIHEALQCLPPSRVRWHAPSPAAWEDLSAVHDDDYLELLARLDGETHQLDEDTSVSPGSVGAALLAAGACVEAGRMCAQTPGLRALCLTRPPGHHALPGRAMGFCLLANLAIGVQSARACPSPHPIRRVALLDWDVHLGNGTVEIFEADADVLVVDVHEAGLWPHQGGLDHIGRGAGRGSTVQLPMPPGSGDADHLAAVRDLFLPIARDHDPDLICVAAGFDAHDRDPLGGQRISTSGFAALMDSVCELAEEEPRRRLMVTLEGGYDVPALAEAAAACARVLAGQTAAPDLGPPRPSTRPTPAVRALIDRASGLHAQARRLREAGHRGRDPSI